MTGSIHTLSSAPGRAMARVGLACAVLGLALATPVSAQMPEMVQKVETGHVRLVDLVDALEFTGSVDAWKEIEISSMARAKIVSIPVEEGDRVAKGDLLFEQDSRAEKIALNRAEAELEKARAELHKMNAGFLPEEIEEARKGVTAAESRLNAAREDWRRIEPLVEFGIIPATEATRSKSAFEVAQSELSRAKSRLDLLEQGFRSEEVQIAEAELKVRQAAVDDIKRRLEDHTVRATESGVIIKHIKEVGEWTNEGDPVLAFVVLDPMKLRIEAPQIHIGSIHSGQRARMRVDGLDGRVFTAEVINVIPQASVGTRNFPVLLRVDNKDGELHAGMFARVSLQVGRKRKGLAVPRSAIQYRGRRLVVYAVMDLPEGFRYEPPPAPEDSRKGRGGPGGRERKMIEPNAMVQEIEVEITDERENDVIVTPAIGSRLEPGAEVVVLGGSRLEDGMLVRRLNPLIPGAG